MQQDIFCRLDLVLDFAVREGHGCCRVVRGLLLGHSKHLEQAVRSALHITPAENV